MTYKDPAMQREYQRMWHARRRSEWFAGKSCVKCGATENLELDHIDPSKKVTHRIWTWRLDRRIEELAKCQPLCSDCHIEKTSSERTSAGCGSQTAYKNGCRCDPCREAHKLHQRAWRAHRKAAA